jgi:hypothetical protein
MAAWCDDPWLKQVRDWGYIPVLQPRTGLEPLRVLSRQGKDLSDIGLVLDLFAAGEIQVPAAGPDEEVTDKKRIRSGRLKAGLGIHFLHGALELLGVKGTSPRLQYRNAKSLRFTASDIRVSKVELIKLDKFLAAADIKDDAPTAMELLTAEALYICTNVIKAGQLVVETESGHDVSADVPPVPVHPGISVSADAGQGSTDQAETSYQGQRAAVFGIKAARVRFSEGKYRCLADSSGSLVVKAGRGSDGTGADDEWLDTDAPFLNIQPG